MIRRLDLIITGLSLNERLIQDKINEIIGHLPQEKESDDMNKKDGIYPNAYDDMANSKCKIDSHLPKEDGLSCECGYFTRAKQPQEKKNIIKNICSGCKEICDPPITAISPNCPLRSFRSQPTKEPLQEKIYCDCEIQPCLLHKPTKEVEIEIFRNILEKSRKVGGRPTKEVPDIRGIFNKIRDVIAQPPDRISKITIEDYEWIRQKLFQTIDKTEQEISALYRKEK